MTEEEAMLLWPKIQSFVKNNGGKAPDINAEDPLERRMAYALVFLKKERQRQGL